MPWTTEQKIFIVEAYFQQMSIHTAQLQFKERFGCREFLVHSLIYRWVNKFRTHGMVAHPLSTVCKGHYTLTKTYEQLRSVATTPLALPWMCGSPRTECAWRTTPIYLWHEQVIIEWWSDLGEWPLIMLVNLVNSWLCLLTVMTRVISLGELYCCLLPQCKALRTCCSGFPIATKWYCDQDVAVVHY